MYEIFLIEFNIVDFFLGFYVMLISLVVFGGAVYLGYLVKKVYDKFIVLIIIGIIFFFVMSVLLYIKVRRGFNSKFVSGGNIGKYCCEMIREDYVCLGYCLFNYF